ncbi:MAG: ABC transporter permease [Chitinophagaceae bacterium]|nr:MAG: ABC transporter permease [Chitinophagaceae bacterium]
MKYNQLTALWAITKASFIAIFRQPSSIFFSLLFPIVFILIFSVFGNGNAPKTKIAFENNSDMNSQLFDSIIRMNNISVLQYDDTASRNKDLQTGKLDAIVNIVTDSNKHYKVLLYSSKASEIALYNLQRSLDYTALQIENKHLSNDRKYAIIPIITQGKEYRSIDFVLPGQLGFSILFSTLFGIAFVFYNMREQLVLKRFYATPISKLNILIGIGTSRLFFQLINVVVLILVGYFFLNFTLVHGFITFLEMILLSIIMLFLLMGAGLIISSLAKNDTSIPLLINLFGFPQMLLSGTYFPISIFPKWLQNICELMPLTQFNDAMRNISFEGMHIFECWKELSYLFAWIVIIYAILYKIMKWE